MKGCRLDETVGIMQTSCMIFFRSWTCTTTRRWNTSWVLKPNATCEGGNMVPRSFLPTKWQVLRSENPLLCIFNYKWNWEQASLAIVLGVASRESEATDTHTQRYSYSSSFFSISLFLYFFIHPKIHTYVCITTYTPPRPRSTNYLD